jgi:hypothetical protein
MRHPAVQEVGVVGVKHEKWGEAPHAFVVLKPGASATDRELIEFVRERLAHFKAPHAVTFVTELPKTATGKIQKYVLRGGKSAISRIAFHEQRRSRDSNVFARDLAFRSSARSCRTDLQPPSGCARPTPAPAGRPCR